MRQLGCHEATENGRQEAGELPRSNRWRLHKSTQTRHPNRSRSQTSTRAAPEQPKTVQKQHPNSTSNRSRSQASTRAAPVRPRTVQQEHSNSTWNRKRSQTSARAARVRDDVRRFASRLTFGRWNGDQTGRDRCTQTEKSVRSCAVRLLRAAHFATLPAVLRCARKARVFSEEHDSDERPLKMGHDQA